MGIIVYGDFNCPYSYLASQRADRLSRAGVAVDWRAVEHDDRLPAAGSRSDGDRAGWERELEEVACLALPGEQVPAAPPILVSNTRAAVAAYAEAVSDGVAGELRRRLFRAIWAGGANLSGPHEVRRHITAAMWPPEDFASRLDSPDFPSLLLRDPNLTRITRRLGGGVTLNGEPLTTAGWRRVRQWRQEWLALPSPAVPAVVGPDQVVRPGVEGLRYLAGLTDAVVPRQSSAARAEAGPARVLARA